MKYHPIAYVMALSVTSLSCFATLPAEAGEVNLSCVDQNGRTVVYRAEVPYVNLTSLNLSGYASSTYCQTKPLPPSGNATHYRVKVAPDSLPSVNVVTNSGAESDTVITVTRRVPPAEQLW